MKKYKYKVGQKIKYKTQKYIEHVCPTCGHEEISSKTIKVEGKIVRRNYCLVHDIANGFVLMDNVKKLKNGSIIYEPYMSDVKLAKFKPVYEVKRGNGELDTITEDQMIKLN